MLRKLICELEWEFNIPKGLRYHFKGDCEICKDNKLALETAPYFVGDVGIEKMKLLLSLMNYPYATDEIIIEHKKHIKSEFMPDEVVANKINDDMVMISQDLPQKIDEEKVLESSIRGLYARKLYLEKTTDYGKEYREIVAQLHQFLALKYKVNGKMPEQGDKAKLSDIISASVLEKINGTKH